MNKTSMLSAGVLVALLGASFPGCTNDSPDDLAGIEPGQQSPQLEADLLQLREEEKLARDVYLTLFEQWQIDTFENISASEQRHMDQVGQLLMAFDIPDPVIDDTIGVFTDSTIAGLYDDLVAQGMQSDVDALLVGATIEDLDIFDIRAMRENTDNTVVIQTYDKLECGSNNHLWAFTGQLAAFDAGYTAQYLSQEEITTIVSAGHQMCGGH